MQTPQQQNLFDEPAVRAARILIDGASDLVFDYAIPPGIEGILPGCRVEIPLRHHTATGTVLEITEPQDTWAGSLKPIRRLIAPEPLISAPLMDMARWASQYYAAPIEQFIRCIVPEPVRQEKHSEKTHKVVRLLSKPSQEEETRLNKRAPRQASILHLLTESPDRTLTLKELGGTAALPPCRALEKQGYLTITEEEEHRDPSAGEDYLPTSALKLNEEQEQALKAVVADIEHADKKPILLQGVTGSGKTEVYLQAVEHTVRQGKSALILVPEISLTPQTLQRFKSRFSSLPGSVAILHSSLSDGERFDEWHSIREGTARIAIGPRSAVFAPLKNLGLIIVDEEHDGSYKQESAPRYQGRDLAVLRAKLEGATVVLGSATPSLETLHNARTGKYATLRLDRRADGQTLPLIRILDMRTEAKDKKYAGVLSERLRMAIDKRLARGEQTILLLNRRGFARSLQCPDCGHNVTCAHCALPLTYHITEDRLICHLCGYRAIVPRECPECRSSNILLQGFGTQKVEAILNRAFPQARLQRIDADISRRKNAVRDILGQFRARKLDILLGTQMIAKGLDFPGVTLVGVLNADLGLCIPDLRASERTFQLLTQVAGRAGRGDLDGEVIIQTFTPHAAAIQFARRHDTDGFADQELDLRRQFEHPPYVHLAVLTLRSTKEELAEYSMHTLYRRLVKNLPPDILVSEPAPAPIPKAYGQYRFQSTIKSHSARRIATCVSREIAAMNAGDDIIITLDIDAYSFM